MIFRQGALLQGSGLAVGIVGALLLPQLVASQMFGVSARDSFSFALVSLLLSAISLLACWAAARRTLKVDPVIALRAD